MNIHKKISVGLLLCCLITSIRAEVTIIEQGLSYDDVLLVPQKSMVSSRRTVSTKTHLTRKITLNIPFVSANMHTITTADMAIAMAKLGGIGIIHRFNSIEEQVREVEKVKRYRNAVIENPVTISSTDTLAQAKELMKAYAISSLLVIDNNNTLIGILTSRDIRFLPPDSTPVAELMTPKQQLIVGTPHISISEAKELLVKHQIEKLPLINDDWTIAGLITAKDIYSKTEYPHASVDKKDRLLVGAAIGVKEDALDRAAALIAAGVDVLVIDIAHGHSQLAIEITKKVKAAFPSIELIAGNVATAQGTRALIEAGADAIKVGIGPGSICTTRIVTGCGYPQLSAIIDCAREAQPYNVPIIADGGIKYSGDITKAIAAGASTVMLGSLLAGTDESPGTPFIKNGKKYKMICGMASFSANMDRKDKTDNQTQTYVPEGVEAFKLYKGSVKETIVQLLGGLWSGMSYCGVTTLEELRGNGTFILISSASLRESHAHDVEQFVS